MKIKLKRASVSQAKRFIKDREWDLLNNEVYTVDENGKKDRIPLIQFCRKYTKEITEFIESTKPARRELTRYRLSQKGLL